jgi:putative endonuclease
MEDVKTDKPDKPDKPYWLYLLECRDGSFYAGITLDVEARFAKHQAGRGAAYTRSRPPLCVLARMQFKNKSMALKAEYAIKQLPKSKKVAFFSSLIMVASNAN